MENKQNCIIGFVGRKGSGKSFALKKFLGSKGTGLPRIVAYDVRDEYTEAGIPNRIEYDLETLRDFLDDHDEAERFAVTYVPRVPAEDIDEFCEIIFEYGNLLVVLEEVPAYASAGDMPDAMTQLTLQGRHKMIDILWAGQRFAEVPKSLTAQTDYFVLFATREPRDINAMTDRVGEETTRRVQTLQPHHALTFDVLSGQASEGVQVPRERLASAALSKERMGHPNARSLKQFLGV